MVAANVKRKNRVHTFTEIGKKLGVSRVVANNEHDRLLRKIAELLRSDPEIRDYLIENFGETE